MALARMDPRELGRRLLPGVGNAIAERFGQWAIQYARDHPNQIQEFGTQAYNWLMDNGSTELGNRAFHYANMLEERVSQWAQDLTRQGRDNLRLGS